MLDWLQIPTDYREEGKWYDNEIREYLNRENNNLPPNKNKLLRDGLGRQRKKLVILNK
jgi:hypothetical protein